MVCTFNISNKCLVGIKSSSSLLLSLWFTISIASCSFFASTTSIISPVYKVYKICMSFRFYRVFNTYNIIVHSSYNPYINYIYYILYIDCTTRTYRCQLKSNSLVSLSCSISTSSLGSRVQDLCTIQSYLHLMCC